MIVIHTGALEVLEVFFVLKCHSSVEKKRDIFLFEIQTHFAEILTPVPL